METCLICRKSGSIYSPIGDDIYSFNCPCCENYLINRTAKALLENNNLSERQRANISGWLFENQNFEITPEKIDWLSAIPTPSFNERADKFILNLEKKTGYAGQGVSGASLQLSYGWCLNHSELAEILDYLVSTSRIRIHHGEYKIAPDGWAHIETLKRRGADSQQGFVAMWFDDKMKNIYDETISKGIEDAWYRPHKVDQREHNGKIDDEIIAQIRRSHFVVADFTGHRGGVYFEAGFAKGLGLEVFWTCKEEDIKDLHFDIRQYNCIAWELDKLPDFRKKLSYKIESVLGRGTYKPDADKDRLGK